MLGVLSHPVYVALGMELGKHFNDQAVRVCVCFMHECACFMHVCACADVTGRLGVSSITLFLVAKDRISH